MTAEYADLQARIGYTFRNEGLLLEALTHSSFANEHQVNRPPDYERLEFLGDAVLEMVTSAHLYHLLPDMKEGDLTKKRAAQVCEDALFQRAEAFDLKKHIRLGRGEEKTGGRERASIIADVTEALIGAIYIDGGQEAAESFIRTFILCDIAPGKEQLDFKSALQEKLQENGSIELRYEMLASEGPEHRKEFRYGVFLNGKKLGEGRGHSKKSAQQRAAREALNKMEE
ncbi:MAG: ribonuclease III [Lachnospiraceae bacterium]|nr:ribonuclease III [Lachnospiraceae bacterium]